jgi:hypothetical protein
LQLCSTIVDLVKLFNVAVSDLSDGDVRAIDESSTVLDRVFVVRPHDRRPQYFLDAPLATADTWRRIEFEQRHRLELGRWGRFGEWTGRVDESLPSEFVSSTPRGIFESVVLLGRWIFGSFLPAETEAANGLDLDEQRERW